MTSRQTVSGVAMIRPIGPHSAVQNVADTISDMADSPVLVPYSNGSTMLLLTSSSTTISATVHSTMSQPGSTAKASDIGNTADSIGPT